MSDGININVVLSLKSCTCGSVYAIPSWVVDHHCPMCAQRKHHELYEKLEARDEQIEALRRSVSSLRGHIGRMQKARG